MSAAMKMTKANLQEAFKALQAEKDALQEELSSKKTAPRVSKGLTIFTSGSFGKAEELFEKALEEQAFVSYKAIHECISEERFYGPKHMREVIAFIEALGIDYLVVNAKGQYGARAPLAKHHEKLKSMGYETMPKLKGKKAKKVKEETTTDKAEMIAALLKLLG